MLTGRTPRLDLHGEEVAVVYALVNEFILDNYKMGNEEVAVIHGKSTNILTKEVHDILKHHQKVASFKLNPFNVGETVIKLKKL